MKLSLEQQTALDKLAKKYRLSLVLLFGSRSRGTAHAKSDTDIAVLGAKPLKLSDLAALEHELRGIFAGAVDVVDLNTAPPLLGGRIMRDARLLAGSPRDFSRERIRFHMRYLDFKPFLAGRRARLSKIFAI